MGMDKGRGAWDTHIKVDMRLEGCKCGTVNKKAFSSSNWGVVAGFYEVRSEPLLPPTLQLPDQSARNSLKTKEKYLYMCIYDFKSGLQIDLYWVRNADSKGVAARYRTAWLDSILYMQKDEWSTTVGFPVRDTTQAEKAYAISALVSFASIINVIPTNYLDLAPSKCKNLVD